MIETALGSVQSWDCDIMGHMNVQHYLGRASEGADVLCLALGLGPRRLREAGLRIAVREQHVRFLRELRPGTAFVTRGGVAGQEAAGLRLYQEIAHTVSGVVAATVTSDLALLDAAGSVCPLPDDVAAAARPLAVERPAHGSPRGLEPYAPRPTASWAEADALGLVITQQGRVLPADCDEAGNLTPRGYMGRFSDAVPNAFARLRKVDRTETGLGGAALEFRLVYRRAARPGDVLAVRSGIRKVSGRTWVLTHWLIDRESGAAVATAEAVNVPLDLATRKAATLPPEEIAVLESRVVPGLSV